MPLSRDIINRIKEKQDTLRENITYSAKLLKKITETNLQKFFSETLTWGIREAKNLVLAQLPPEYRTQNLNNPTLTLHWFTFNFNPFVYKREVKSKLYDSPTPKVYPLKSHDYGYRTELLSGSPVPAPNLRYIVRYNPETDRLEARTVDITTEEGIRYVWGASGNIPQDTLEFTSLRGLGKDDMIDLAQSGVPYENSLVQLFRNKASIGFQYDEDLRKPIQVDRINMEGFTQNESEIINDYVTFYFKSVVSGWICQFRAFINSFGESTNASYNTQDYIFNIIKMYSYINVETTYNISFTLFPMSKQELSKIWGKLSFLKAHLFPAKRVTPGGNFVPPVLEVTLGNVWRKRKVLLTSLNISFGEDTVWELEPGLQLPQWIKVDLNLILLYEQDITTEDWLQNRVKMFDYTTNKPPSTLAASDSMIDPATGVALDISAFKYPEPESFNLKLAKLDILKNLG